MLTTLMQAVVDAAPRYFNTVTHVPMVDGAEKATDMHLSIENLQARAAYSAIYERSGANASEVKGELPALLVFNEGDGRCTLIALGDNREDTHAASLGARMSVLAKDELRAALREVTDRLVADIRVSVDPYGALDADENVHEVVGYRQDLRYVVCTPHSLEPYPYNEAAKPVPGIYS